VVVAESEEDLIRFDKRLDGLKDKIKGVKDSVPDITSILDSSFQM
jgi:hypothetical protein